MRRFFFKDAGPALPDILGRALRENEGRLEGGKHLSLEEGNTCPWTRKTLAPGGGKRESQLFVLSKIAEIV